ncbi:hypothetical protein L2737_03990 [Shewanella electrodiphila]|uniref:Uncharacterized protein n=1 Tax=Shewanella electrodiphila TaxID=934143 RepID=A0ABT0KKX5_9GAMM|nr:hypothetical protein [Shewanella electrodiphila]MCL1044493.1 hypothetical protein [Shewanella electrodiphila]
MEEVEVSIKFIGGRVTNSFFGNMLGQMNILRKNIQTQTPLHSPIFPFQFAIKSRIQIITATHLLSVTHLLKAVTLLFTMGGVLSYAAFPAISS